MNNNSPQLVTALTIVSFTSATVGLVCLRLVLVLDFIDPQTGFYMAVTFNAAAFPYLYAMFIAALLVFAIRRGGFAAKTPGALRMAAPAASMLGAAIMIPQVMTVITLVQGVQNGMRHPVDLLFDVFALLVYICSGAAFILLALELLANRAEPAFTRTTALALPILWRCFLLVERFVSKPVPAAESDGMLAILLDVFAVIFMVAHARVITKLELRSGVRMLLFSGCAYMLTALLLFVPWLATLISGNAPLEPMLAMRWLADTALAVYSAVCVAAVSKKGNETA